MLLAAGADVNQVTGYGWSPLLVATQNRYYKLGAYLLDHGADPNLANKGGWMPLYLATDNRNIESGDYPVRKGDMDHLEFIKLLLDKGANVNARMKDSTETRTVFTNQWLDENGATAFLRASQSGDLALMKLLLARGADPKIATVLGVTALHVAAGIGWVEGITYEWSPKDTLEAVKMLLDLGLDPNAQADTGRVALHGAAHKGATEVVQLLVGPRRQAGCPRLRQHRQPRRQARRAHLAAGGLRRRSGPRRRAVGDRASGDRPAPAQADDGSRPAGAADGPHAGIDLHHRRVRLTDGRATRLKGSCPSTRCLKGPTPGLSDRLTTSAAGDLVTMRICSRSDRDRDTTYAAGLSVELRDHSGPSCAATALRRSRHSLGQHPCTRLKSRPNLPVERVAAGVRRLLDARHRRQQQPLGVTHADAPELLEKRQAGVLLEQPIEVRRRHVHMLRRGGQAKRRIGKPVFEISHHPRDPEVRRRVVRRRPPCTQHARQRHADSRRGVVVGASVGLTDQTWQASTNARSASRTLKTAWS